MIREFPRPRRERLGRGFFFDVGENRVTSAAVLTVTRTSFLDRPLDLADLAELAALWAAWFRVTPRPGGGGITGPRSLRLDVTLWGAPAADVELLRRMVDAAVMPHGCSVAVSDDRPDEIEVVGP